MRKLGISLIAVLALFYGFSASGKQTTLADAAIIKILMEESISSYPGNCPCPYNSAKNGSRCGKRSAYNRPNGYAPLCFKDDVSKEMIQQYRGRAAS
ncbi:hypothetical protein [Pseudomonas sp.]|uniref:hypothetical protein n=1 Tax=Pseudomonas sp. TaxID=306 RepID=UPI002620900D|nr:hypothetical protein [Pseudomonas sp.]